MPRGRRARGSGLAGVTFPSSARGRGVRARVRRCGIGQAWLSLRALLARALGKGGRDRGDKGATSCGHGPGWLRDLLDHAAVRVPPSSRRADRRVLGGNWLRSAGSTRRAASAAPERFRSALGWAPPPATTSSRPVVRSITTMPPTPASCRRAHATRSASMATRSQPSRAARSRTKRSARRVRRAHTRLTRAATETASRSTLAGKIAKTRLKRVKRNVASSPRTIRRVVKHAG